MKSQLRRNAIHLLKGVLLLALIAASGVGLGYALGFPLSKVEFEESAAVRVDHSRLAGQIDVQDALVQLEDLPRGWELGDQSLAMFGMLGAEYCGEAVDLPTHLGDAESVVFTDPTDGAILISQAVRTERWQSAREYVRAVESSVSSCSEFYRDGFDGSRYLIEVRPGMGDAPVADYVARSFVTVDGSGTQVWSLMVMGDVLIQIMHSGPTRPTEGFMDQVETAILRRVDPAEFSPGGLFNPQDESMIADAGLSETELPSGVTDADVMVSDVIDGDGEVDIPDDALGGVDGGD